SPQVTPSRGVPSARPSPVHPPQRSGRAGHEVQEARGAGGPAKFSPSPSSSRYYTKSASPAGQRPNARESRRRWRHDRRRFLWLASPRERVRKCGRVRLAGDTVIRVRDGIAHYSGLMSCGDVWVCPACSGKIRNARAVETAAAAGRWLMGGPDQLAGCGLYMVTLTVPHEAGMPLGQLWSVIGKAMQNVRSGKRYQRIKADLGIVATATAKEVTHGQNGWHPHLHLLVFTAKPASGEALFDLLTYMRDAWQREVAKAGLGEPDRLHGVRVDECYSGVEAGLYLA